MQPSDTPTLRFDRPLLVWDGDCGFCKRCVLLWRRIVKEPIDDCPYQECKVQRLPVSDPQFARRVYLFERDGTPLSGAAAVYRSLQSTRLAFLHRLYSRSAAFAAFSEKAYAWVARHRSLFSKLLGPFLPDGR